MAIDPLSLSVDVAASGLKAQSERLRIVSENLANAQSTGRTAGAEPYQRKTVSFASALDPDSGGAYVRIQSVELDGSEFPVEYDPTHQAADENGFVMLPNVNPLIEMADMTEANRSYEANLQVIRQARELISMTIDLMRAQ
jgi:flagellar basal-body rod protein FlgC